jgi:flotillin
MLVSIAIGVVIALLALAVIVAFMFRRVVPTNMVHIVQSSKKTTAYGRGKDDGNTYYEWPSFLPFIGVNVTTFPESIFQVNLSDYEAYDSARLPFMVDVGAFFRVDDASTAAQRVSSFGELQQQLVSVLQGAVRRILATNSLEEIMQERSSFGVQFTNEVKDQIKEWGVLPVKTIEFMDIRDSKGSQVIQNIMAKEKSRIEMESRVQVAENMQNAQLKEIDAQRTVDVQQQDALQQVGIRTAEKDKIVGIAKEQSQQEIKAQAKITTERSMEVTKVEQVRHAEIARDVAVVHAEQQAKVAVVAADADKQTTIVRADGQLEAAKREAEGIKVNGLAAAEAEKAMLMAPVDTQITLAKEIGENQGYQQYLITIEQVKANQFVGIEMAKALGQSDLKIIANSGDIGGGVKNLVDLLSPQGGTAIGGMLEALKNTDAGKALLSKVGQ